LKGVVLLCWVGLLAGCGNVLHINHLQFVGSHNSYKKAMAAEQFAALKARNPEAAASLEYSHVPISKQLDLGLRKLELDVFYDPAGQRFPVGHVQVIDMNSHCADLGDCLAQIRAWSDAHPRHVPLWISFNAKDQKIAGLPAPSVFDEHALHLLDEVLVQALGDRLIWPAAVKPSVSSGKQVPQWPALSKARGKVILILDETGKKREWYWQNWRQRPMFTNAPVDHAAAAIMILNDPLKQQQQIRDLVAQGYMVRTRADADTREARLNNTARREAAFASGAQAVSTDYYLPAESFDSDYQVRLDPPVRCNPVLTSRVCSVSP
jgi:calcium-dependent phosphoinositide phospholipase C